MRAIRSTLSNPLRRTRYLSVCVCVRISVMRVCVSLSCMRVCVYLCHACERVCLCASLRASQCVCVCQCQRVPVRARARHARALRALARPGVGAATHAARAGIRPAVVPWHPVGMPRWPVGACAVREAPPGKLRARATLLAESRHLTHARAAGASRDGSAGVVWRIAF